MTPFKLIGAVAAGSLLIAAGLLPETKQTPSPVSDAGALQVANDIANDATLTDPQEADSTTAVSTDAVNAPAVVSYQQPAPPPDEPAKTAAELYAKPTQIIHLGSVPMSCANGSCGQAASGGSYQYQRPRLLGRIFRGRR